MQASQVSVYRKDLIDNLPLTWSDLIELAKKNQVLWPS